MDKIITSKSSIKGEIIIPPDKSITHRLIMLSSISNATTKITNPLLSDDCISTINCMKNLGVNIIKDKDGLIIKGLGLHGLKQGNTLNANNSATTMRLLSGILSGQSFSSEITGDNSLINRPMDRIITPLSKLGANIISKYNNKKAPLCISPPKFIHKTEDFITFSAQVKSSILFFGLYSKYPVTITEKFISRNHSYLLLKEMGANIKKEGNKISIYPTETLNGIDIRVPGDISSASYFIALSILLKNSEIILKNIGINETRIGFLNVLKRMDANIYIQNKRKYGPEDVADLVIKSSNLKNTTVLESEIPLLIDEIPILSIIMALSQGKSKIIGAKDLRYKESDRLKLIYNNLKNMGASISLNGNDIYIEGVPYLNGATIQTDYDHRIAMAFSIAGMVAKGITKIKNYECVSVSFPTFYKILDNI